jgi:hypothetical protein
MLSVTLEISEGYLPPQILKTTSPEENAFILEAGIKSFEISKSEANKRTHKESFLILQNQARAEFEPLEKKMRTEVENLEKQVSQYKNTIETLQKRSQFEEQQRMEMEAKIRNEERRNREDILREKESRIQLLEKDLRQAMYTVGNTVCESQRNLSDSFQTFRDQLMKINTGSSLKGKSAESIFTDLLQRTFGSAPNSEEFSVENLGSTESHSGDIHMVWRNSKILWEIKNYSKAVDKKEVEKFHRDMITNTDISVGVLVSMATGIVGHTKAGNIDLQQLPDGRVCIYISYFDKHGDAQEFLQSLQPFLEVFTRRINEWKGNLGNETIERFKIVNETILSLIRNHQNKINELKTCFSLTKKRQESIWNEFQVKIKETDHYVKLMLETLLSMNSEARVESTTYLENENLIFKEYEWGILTTTEKKFIEIIRKSFRVVEDAKMPATELREILKQGGISEEQQNKFREEYLQEDVWKKGSKDIRHLQKDITK